MLRNEKLKLKKDLKLIKIKIESKKILINTHLPTNGFINSAFKSK